MTTPLKSISRITSAFMVLIFGINMVYMPVSMAQVAFLPTPGTMVGMTNHFDPAVVRGVKLYPDNPFKFDFIVDTGSNVMSNAMIKEQGHKLIAYFLASLTTPEKEMWVNLSPYEKARIIPTSFGQTEMGTQLLAQDYMLKQIMATALYPERQLGQAFWAKVYAQAQSKFGTTNIPVSTFNKVWIVPNKAVVYENAQTNSVFVVESSLKVMLEQDYLAANKHKAIEQMGYIDHPKSSNEASALSSSIIKQIVIPALEKEVNEGKNFASLRQVYNSLILASWYKKNLKDNILVQGYVDHDKTLGVNVKDKTLTERIYRQYLKAYKKGVFNYIKEDLDPLTQESIPRKYFSGGFVGHVVTTAASPAQISAFNQAMSAKLVRNFLAVIAAGAGIAYAGTALASTSTDNGPGTQSNHIVVDQGSSLSAKVGGMSALRQLEANHQLWRTDASGQPNVEVTKDSDGEVAAGEDFVIKPTATDITEAANLERGTENINTSITASINDFHAVLTSIAPQQKYYDGLTDAQRSLALKTAETNLQAALATMRGIADAFQGNGSQSDLFHAQDAMTDLRAKVADFQAALQANHPVATIQPEAGTTIFGTKDLGPGQTFIPEGAQANEVFDFNASIHEETADAVIKRMNSALGEYGSELTRLQGLLAKNNDPNTQQELSKLIGSIIKLKNSADAVGYAYYKTSSGEVPPSEVTITEHQELAYEAMVKSAGRLAHDGKAILRIAQKGAPIAAQAAKPAPGTTVKPGSHNVISGVYTGHYALEGGRFFIRQADIVKRFVAHEFSPKSSHIIKARALSTPPTPAPSAATTPAPLVASPSAPAAAPIVTLTPEQEMLRTYTSGLATIQEGPTGLNGTPSKDDLSGWKVLVQGYLDNSKMYTSSQAEAFRTQAKAIMTTIDAKLKALETPAAAPASVSSTTAAVVNAPTQTAKPLVTAKGKPLKLGDVAVAPGKLMIGGANQLGKGVQDVGKFFRKMIPKASNKVGANTVINPNTASTIVPAPAGTIVTSPDLNALNTRLNDVEAKIKEL